MTSIDEAKQRPAILVRGPGDLALWAIKCALRLSTFKTAGDYYFCLRVREDGVRELAVINDKPHKYEHLGV